MPEDTRAVPRWERVLKTAHPVGNTVGLPPMPIDPEPGLTSPREAVSAVGNAFSITQKALAEQQRMLEALEEMIASILSPEDSAPQKEQRPQMPSQLSEGIMQLCDQVHRNNARIATLIERVTL